MIVALSSCGPCITRNDAIISDPAEALPCEQQQKCPKNGLPAARDLHQRDHGPPSGPRHPPDVRTIPPRAILFILSSTFLFTQRQNRSGNRSTNHGAPLLSPLCSRLPRLSSSSHCIRVYIESWPSEPALSMSWQRKQDLCRVLSPKPSTSPRVRAAVGTELPSLCWHQQRPSVVMRMNVERCMNGNDALPMELP